MLGILLAITGGLVLSVADLGKRALLGLITPELIVCVLCGVGVVANCLYIAVTGIPPIDWYQIWLPVLVVGALGAGGEALFMYGLKGTDLSLAMPLFAFMPIFAATLEFLMNGSLPSPLGCLGVCTICIGALFLEGTSGKIPDPFQLFRRLLTDRACRLILLSVANGPLFFLGQRWGAGYSSPVVFFTLILAVMWFIFLVLSARSHLRGQRIQIPRRAVKLLLCTAIGWSVGLTLVAASFNYTLAAYAMSSFQIQIPCSILLGGLLLKEQHVRRRLAAGVVMIAGVILIFLTQ